MSGAKGDTAEAAADPRHAQLVDLLGRLPADKAEKLRGMLSGLAVAEPSSPLLADIIHRLSLRAGDAGEDRPNALMRRICMLFEPFLVTATAPVPDWLIQRASLTPWWTASMAASPALRRDEEDFIRAVRAQQPGAIEQAVASAQEHLTAVVQQIMADGAPPELCQDLRKIAALLPHRVPFGAALAALGFEGPVRPGQEIDLDEALVDGFARQYLALARGSGLDPAWLGHAVMNRLARPWTGLLLVKAVIETGEVSPLAQTELAPLTCRALGHLAELARAAEVQLRRAERTRNALEIARAAVAAEQYFAALDEVASLAGLDGFSRHAQVRLTGRDAVAAAVSRTLGLFEEVIGNFLSEWTPRAPDGDDPELSAVLDVAGLLGRVRALGPAYRFDQAAEAITARLAQALDRTPPAATGSALRQWTQHRAELLGNLGLEQG